MSWRDGESSSSSQHATHCDDSNDADGDESDEHYKQQGANNSGGATSRKFGKKNYPPSKQPPRDPPGALHNNGVDEDEHDVVQTTTTNNDWQPQDTPSVLEFTHTIEDYAKKRQGGCKKAEYSAVVSDDKGNRWRLIIYVNGNGRASNHHLSLFLQVAQAEDLPFGWKKTVSYVLTLEHPQAELRYAKRNPDKTFKMCPKAIDWGWSQFISSDRIQQEGFVQNDTLIITAHVTVKSSDTKIVDGGDAELYLKCAVEEGNAEAIQLCLDQGASINCQFKDDLYTPLHTACSSNQTSASVSSNNGGLNSNNSDVLFKLLEHGASVDAVNKWKETPLLIAANNGHTIAVETLLKAGSNPSLCSEAGWSALTFAAHKGYNDIVALLLRAGAPVNTPVAEDSSTPLHKACAGNKPGHSKCVRLLLRSGADVHWFNKWRETPLLTAANHGHTEAVAALIEYNADPCKCTDTGWSPLSIAAYKGHNDCVRLLLEDGAPTEEDDTTLSALLQAATKGLPDTVELLLLHGADHTVTTKKGDTALSILVEQNLIDCAVEMVTEYGASIARCSKDRKKVQRARLLINLRMKQQEKEKSTDSDESDGSDRDNDDAAAAQHESLDFEDSVAAEEKARAAEEALLMELAKEDEEAKREEAKANSKQAKKKKKKERERQQRLKEEEEERKAKQKEIEERDRIRREKDAQIRKQRQERERARIEEEQRMVEQVKEREEKQKGWDGYEKKRDRVKKPEPARSSLSPVGVKTTAAPQAKPANVAAAPKAVTDPTPVRKIVAPQAKKPMIPLAGNRRWETNSMSERPSSSSIPGPATNARSVSSSSQNSPTSVAPLKLRVEHPEVARFRQEKFVELIRRCDQALRINDLSLRRAIYRWIVRACHDDSKFFDPLIPSWVDTDQLSAFFHRQFISEERRMSNGSALNLNIERLKEAAIWVASLCSNLGQRVADYAQEIAFRLPEHWNDASIGTTVSSPLNGTGYFTKLSFGNRVHSSISTASLNTLRQRHQGRADRFLTHALVASLRYETLQLLVGETDLDLSVLPETHSLFAQELRVSGDLWSTPFVSRMDSVYWGRFDDVDSLFDGRLPFGSESDELDDILVHHGGSILACLPSDTFISAKYTKRIVDSLAEAELNAVPLSFALFIRGYCLPDMRDILTEKDLTLLDSRLGRQHRGLVSKIHVLESGQHLYCLNDTKRSQIISASPTLFVLLQNEYGRYQFNISDDVLSRILGSMKLNPPTFAVTSIPSSIGIATEFSSQFRDSPVAGFHDVADPISPDPQRSIRSGFGAIGDSTSISSQFSPSNESFGLVQRRGLLFDLIDNPADDELDNDIVSGMLSNLDAGLFQDVNLRSETVDIEAISLMGMDSVGLPAPHPFQRSSD